MAILVDTGVLYALADRDDAWHARADEFVAACAEVLLVPVPVSPETTYRLRTRLGAVAEQRSSSPSRKVSWVWRRCDRCTTAPSRSFP
jgi:predicted nucleic acid-binding protein